MTYEKAFRVEMTVRVVGNEELTDMDPGKVANRRQPHAAMAGEPRG